MNSDEEGENKDELTFDIDAPLDGETDDQIEAQEHQLSAEVTKDPDATMDNTISEVPTKAYNDLLQQIDDEKREREKLLSQIEDLAEKNR